MSYRFLLIGKDEKGYLQLKSLLEKITELPLTFEWLPYRDIPKGLDIFNQYDVVLIVHEAAAPMIKPEKVQSLEQAIAMQDLKSNFVGMASHEFRTPLTSISSSADLIEVYLKRGEYDQVNKHLERIKRSVDDMNNILSRFLSLDQLEKGTKKVEIHKIDLPGLVTEVSNQFNRLLKTGQTILYEHVGPETVALDPILLKEVLLNLVSNASKYSPADVSILISTTVSKEQIMLCVTDHGMGIPPEEYTHLFNRFFRASNAANIQGTGLGLHLSKSMVEMMQGNIGYSSELGKGSTFWAVFSMPE